MTPYALILYGRFRRGATVAELVVETGIPQDRIVQRLCSAAAFLKRKRLRGDRSSRTLVWRVRNAGYCTACSHDCGPHPVYPEKSR